METLIYIGLVLVVLVILGAFGGVILNGVINTISIGVLAVYVVIAIAIIAAGICILPILLLICVGMEGYQKLCKK